MLSRPRLLTFAGLTLAAVAVIWPTWWLLGRTGANDGAGIANVLALGPGVVSAVAAVVALRPRFHADDLRELSVRARRLLVAVSSAEARLLAQLLGDTGEAKPADIGFEQPGVAFVRWRTDGGDQTGSLATIAGYYGQLDRGRLVILGEGGAGKTVLAVKLLLDLSRAAQVQADQGTAPRFRVPIRMSLSGFTCAADTPPAELRTQFDTWLAANLTTTYGVKRVVAHSLVTDGWILPILDGLDELDADGATPDRARQVVEILNQPTGPTLTPVVLTCRTDRYRVLAGHEPLTDATVVELRALEPAEVVNWLRHRFPDPGQRDGVQSRWQPVIGQLRRHPRGRLAMCLCSPLMLYLAATVYRGHDTSPRELCHLDATTLRTHLLAELIPAVATHHPRADGRHYDSTDVHRWLTTLADHLHTMGRLGRSATDLHVYELWRTTGNPARPGRFGRYLCTGLLAAMTVPPIIWFLAVGQLHWPPEPIDWLGLAIAAVMFMTAPLMRRRPTSGPPYGIDTRIEPTQLKNALVLIGGGLTAFALLIIVTDMIQLGADQGLNQAITEIFARVTMLLSLALTAVLFIGPMVSQQAIERPSTLMRRALVRDTYNMALLTFGFMLTFWVFGLEAALAVGVMASTCVTAAFSQWPQYTITLLGYARRALLPVHLGSFLDWAHAAGLLRLSGVAVQFRHRNLQEYLGTAILDLR